MLLKFQYPCTDCVSQLHWEGIRHHGKHILTIESDAKRIKNYLHMEPSNKVFHFLIICVYSGCKQISPPWIHVFLLLPSLEFLHIWSNFPKQKGHFLTTSTTRTLPRSCLEVKPIPLPFSALVFHTTAAKHPKSRHVVSHWRDTASDRLSLTHHATAGIHYGWTYIVLKAAHNPQIQSICLTNSSIQRDHEDFKKKFKKNHFKANLYNLAVR